MGALCKDYGNGRHTSRLLAVLPLALTRSFSTPAPAAFTSAPSFGWRIEFSESVRIKTCRLYGLTKPSAWPHPPVPEGPVYGPGIISRKG